MSAQAPGWFARATASAAAWTAEELAAGKRGARVSVVIPARNEAPTIGDIVRGIRTRLVEDVPLVDELVVIDSDSTDDTAAIAAGSGAVVHAARAIRPDLGGHAGKGEALWKSQFVTTGDLLVFVDADLTAWGTHFVVGLLGPLLTRPGVQLVKGYYDRVLDDGSGRHAPQGGRVTELVARPLLNLRWPALAQVVQPLAGEWAIRRDAFARLPVPVGYGVELATLLGVSAKPAPDATPRVALGPRAHPPQPVHALGLRAADPPALARRGLAHAAPASALWQFDRSLDPPW